MVQRLRLHAANAGGLGLVPGQGTGSRKLQLTEPACCNQDPEQPNKYTIFLF